MFINDLTPGLASSCFLFVNGTKQVGNAVQDIVQGYLEVHGMQPWGGVNDFCFHTREHLGAWTCRLRRSFEGQKLWRA